MSFKTLSFKNFILFGVLFGSAVMMSNTYAQDLDLDLELDEMFEEESSPKKKADSDKVLGLNDLEEELNFDDFDSYEEEKGRKKLQKNDTKGAINEELDGYEDLFPEEAQLDNKKKNKSEKLAKEDDEDSELNLSELDELETVLDETPKGSKNIISENNQNLNLSKEEDLDDLRSLKEDLGEPIFSEKASDNEEDDLDLELQDNQIVNKKKMSKDKQAAKPVQIFEIGKEEYDLIQKAKFLENKIPENEWTEVAGSSKTEKYVVQEGEWLWKISERLFGSGFYYSKIWALNPYITNPHEIKPGMTLVFDTGDDINLPSIKVGSFSERPDILEKQVKSGGGLDLSYFGEEIESDWLKERAELVKNGIHIQIASDYTYEDLFRAGQDSLNKEYEKYYPPVPKIVAQKPPKDEYDNSGFDKNAQVKINFKEGFFLNTFISSNFVLDLGTIESAKNSNTYLQIGSTIYVKFDTDVNVSPGDLFTTYNPGGKITHKRSDRSGFKYTTSAQIRAIRKNSHLWECEIIDLSGLVQRGDRVTLYTPKIDKIYKTFNARNIEAIIIQSYSDKSLLSTGEVVYLDRGRVDGVELGNIFEIFSFKDPNTEEKITVDPTYKIGELAVINLSDNFATALITTSSEEIGVGQLALSKTIEQAARDARVKNRTLLKEAKKIEDSALEELDVELNLEDINDDLLDKADKVELTEDELEELEKQEREKSIIQDQQRDLRELEKLEREIELAENELNSAKMDEDKYLEQQNLNELEKDIKQPDPDALESLDEIEREIGKKYMDEDINSKENPYGLTEYDLEEIDELLNSELN